MSPCYQFGGAIVCTDIGWPDDYSVRGGKKMVAKKVSKAAPKIPKGKIGKAVKRK